VFKSTGPILNTFQGRNVLAYLAKMYARNKKIFLKYFPGLGDEIDPAMMAALMATTALVARGASNEEVRNVRLSF
jgi:hypothetical protein